MAVAVDGVGEAVGAIGKGLGQPVAHQPAGAGKQLRQRIGDDIRAEALEDLGDAGGAELDARHQRGHVADALVGKARVAVEDGERRLVGPAGVDQLGRRDDDAFLENLRRIRADRAGVQAADIGEVRPAHDEAAKPVAEKHRRKQHLVVGMGDCSARGVAVVVPVDVAGMHGLDRERVEDRRGQVAEDRHHRADRHHAPGIEDRRVEVLLFADERGNGGALDQRLHLGLGRRDGAADDLQRDRIADRAVRTCFRPLPGHW